MPKAREETFLDIGLEDDPGGNKCSLIAEYCRMPLDTIIAGREVVAPPASTFSGETIS
jgi:hypothetical protein